MLMEGPISYRSIFIGLGLDLPLRVSPCVCYSSSYYEHMMGCIVDTVTKCQVYVHLVYIVWRRQ